MSPGVQIRVTKSGYVIYAVDQNIQDVLKLILNWCGLLIPISAAVHKDVALFGAQRCKISDPNEPNLPTKSGIGRIGMDFSLVRKGVAYKKKF